MFCLICEFSLLLIDLSVRSFFSADPSFLGRRLKVP